MYYGKYIEASGVLSWCHHNPVSLPLPLTPSQFHVITVIVGLEFLFIFRQFMMFWRVGKFKQILLKLHLLKCLFDTHYCRYNIIILPSYFAILLEHFRQCWTYADWNSISFGLRRVWIFEMKLCFKESWSEVVLQLETRKFWSSMILCDISYDFPKEIVVLGI